MTHQEYVLSVISNVSSAGYITSRERNDLEYKQSFGQKSWAKYAKTMAAFANNRGGYIIFGIKDNPRQLVGVNSAFKDFAQERFSEYLNSLFAPEIMYESGIVEIGEKSVGFIYTEEAESKPIVAQKTESSEKIASGDVFYRYRARSEKIKCAEMHRIIADRVAKERENILKLFEVIRKSETANLGIINYDKGSFSTPSGVDVAVDRRLIVQVLRKAKFIKEGSFSETDGQPVLKVTGNIDLAEEIPVPDIEPDIQYPYIQKNLAQKLNITPYEIQALVWKYKMKGQKKFHLEITTSKSGKVHKFSDIALQFLADKINVMKSNPGTLNQIKAEYTQRR
ncbi:MAG: ATP-binding protein [Lawsonibacter sp.]|jgi:hypothetical protein